MIFNLNFLKFIFVINFGVIYGIFLNFCVGGGKRVFYFVLLNILRYFFI